MAELTLPRSRARRRSRVSRDRILSLALITPSIIAVAIFVYGFIGWTGWASLAKWNSIRPDYTFVGLANYASLFANPRFQVDLRNTFVFTVCFISASLVLGLTLANLLDRRIRGESFFRSVYLFPMAISFIVTGVVWKWLLNPGAGFNTLFGLDPKTNRWYTDPTVLSIPATSPVGAWLHDIGLGFFASTTFGVPVAMLSVVIAAVWQMSGFVMALYLAGLRGIPEELREAARVDGAGEWDVFRRVILPLLAPITLSAVIILGHISLKIYDLTVAMSPTGPAFATDVPANFMWQTSFQGNFFSQGAAIAIVMLVLVATLVVPYLVYTRRTEVET
jgi:glucose/mannose transport system permease protein